MGTFLGAAVLIVFTAYIAMYLGYYGALIIGVLVLAGAITACINAYREITRRLDRIEQALGIETPEEKEPDGGPAPDDGSEEV